MSTVRLGGGQGFYGDDVTAVRPMLEEGIDYLCCDALAELTLAILQKDRARDPSAGYAKDLGAYLRAVLPYVVEGRTRLVTNAGGVNPAGAGAAALQLARSLGMSGLRVATVVGDDVRHRLPEWRERGVSLANAETGEPWRDAGDVVVGNAYLGARPIVEALDRGAQVVVTGRVADPSLFVAPLVHEFGWAWDDWDRLAAATAVGHLCECSGQSTGGNLSGDWWTVPEPWTFGFPIAECEPDGSAVITKAAGTGGRVDFDTVRHQLLYEIHDPAAYVTPDAVADFTSVQLGDAGRDRVAVSGVRGRPATETYKVLLATSLGYSGDTRVSFGWPDAYAKARATAHIFRRRVEVAGLHADEWLEEYWGVNALHGPTVPLDLADEAPEVGLRIAWRCADATTASRIARQMPPLGLSAPPWGLTATGRTLLGAPSELFALWPALVDRRLVDTGVEIDIQEA